MSTTPLSITIAPVTPPLDGAAADRIVDLLEQRMTALHIALQARIVETKLSGQVLNEVTGALRNSIQQMTERSGDLITSTVFTDLVYAAIHEYGGTITPKAAKALVFEIDGRTIFAQMVKMPARPYMGPSYDEMREEIVSELQAALYEGLAE